MSQPRTALVRQALMLLMARCPTGKPITVRMTGIDGKFEETLVTLRFDAPGVLHCYYADNGEPVFSADATELTQALA